MACSDFIADFLTVIRNAANAKKDKVTIKSSNLTVRIAEILQEEGFIEAIKPFKEGNKNFARIHLKYVRGKVPAIQGIKRISTPGCRVYSGHEEIRGVHGGLGISIVSTSQGVMTGSKARKEKIGGEVLCQVW
ncbi:MAG: 30S ribosomal protein S8 [Candidatus Omnitrophica bacterium]|nr:30S ribosomal protein S8 [Candidatus Omnitrophota bacterium]